RSVRGRGCRLPLRSVLRGVWALLFALLPPLRLHSPGEGYRHAWREYPAPAEEQQRCCYSSRDTPSADPDGFVTERFTDLLNERIGVASEMGVAQVDGLTTHQRLQRFGQFPHLRHPRPIDQGRDDTNMASKPGRAFALHDI